MLNNSKFKIILLNVALLLIAGCDKDINSVEQLAGLSDGACHGLGKDVLDHRKEAKQFLAGEHTKPQQPVVGE